jgi:hypothetical protein
MTREGQSRRTAPPTVPVDPREPGAAKPALQLTAVLNAPRTDRAIISRDAAVVSRDAAVVSRDAAVVENEWAKVPLPKGTTARPRSCCLDERPFAGNEFDDPHDEKTTQFNRHESARGIPASPSRLLPPVWPQPLVAAPIPPASKAGLAPPSANSASRLGVSGERTRALTNEGLSSGHAGAGQVHVGATASAYRPPPSSGIRFALGLCAGVVLASVVFVLRGQSGRVAMFVAGEGNAALDHFTVEVDGQRRCDTRPCVLDLGSGTHFLRVEANGYAPHEVEIAIESGTSLALNVTLRRDCRITAARSGGR